MEELVEKYKAEGVCFSSVGREGEKESVMFVLMHREMLMSVRQIILLTY